MLGALLEDLIPSAMRRYGVPGVAVAAVESGRHHISTFGVEAGGTRSRPIARHVRFDLEGLTKPFTASAVMALARAGALELDVPVAEVIELSEIDVAGQAITPRQLLSHHAGVGDDCRGLLNGGSLGPQAARLLARPKVLQPGTAYSYSNVGYAVLGALVEHVTGLPFENALVERALHPLGLQGEFARRDLLQPAIAGRRIGHDGELQPSA